MEIVKMEELIEIVESLREGQLLVIKIEEDDGDGKSAG